MEATIEFDQPIPEQLAEELFDKFSKVCFGGSFKIVAIESRTQKEIKELFHYMRNDLRFPKFDIISNEE